MDTTDLLAMLDQLTAVIYTLAGLVVILCCYIVTLPVVGGGPDQPLFRRKVKAVEHCKLHARPLSECIDQHRAEDE